MMDNISLYCRRQADIPRHKMNAPHIPTQNRCWYQKVFPKSIKPAGYTGSRRKLMASKGRASSLTLILQSYLPKTER